MNKKKKIEIIDIRLDIDLTAEIKKRADTLNKEIKNQTKGLVERARLKSLRTKSQKKRTQEVWEIKCQRAFDKLVSVADTEFPWLTTDELMNIVDSESVSLQSIIQRLRSFIKKEGHWVLTRKKQAGQSIYKLDRFG